MYPQLLKHTIHFTLLQQLIDQQIAYDRTNVPMNTALHTLATKYAAYLPLEKLLGLVLILGGELPSTTATTGAATGPPPPILPCIKRGEVGGVFLARSPLPTTTQQVRAGLQQYSTASTGVYGTMLPLLLGADDEGGHRTTYPHVYQPWPTLMTIGATNDPARAYHYGRGYGKDLHKAGFNINFSPDSDVNDEPNNPVIGPRSFGSNPQHVSTMVNSTVRGFLDEGIHATLKHWPGHGATTSDSHKTLPEIKGTLDARLSKVELLPFVQNMLTPTNPHGASLVMSAHVIATGIDPLYPMSISTKGLVQLLKQRLHFQGVVVSDALNMRGLTQFLEQHPANTEGKLMVHV